MNLRAALRRPQTSNPKPNTHSMTSLDTLMPFSSFCMNRWTLTLNPKPKIQTPKYLFIIYHSDRDPQKRTPNFGEAPAERSSFHFLFHYPNMSLLPLITGTHQKVIPDLGDPNLLCQARKAQSLGFTWTLQCNSFSGLVWLFG